MKREQLVFACCSDLAGKVRGKAFPAADFDKRLMRGVGWTPTNVQITCFDTIAESPFGALGDVLLMPDAGTRTCVAVEDGDTTEEFVISDIKTTDGKPWAFCTRSLLKAALDRLERIAGVTLVSAFEHEFQLVDRPGAPGEAFTLAGFRSERRFGETLVSAMRVAGINPDSFLREFGQFQFEVTLGPQEGVTAADHALIVRELVYAIAAALDRRATLAPMRDPAGVGNGVHIHMSFRDGSGRPTTFEAGREYGLSRIAGQFVAGILKYLDGIVALTAPSVASYLRLTPHRWSAAFNNLGFRDREAAVRICPVSEMSDLDAAAQFNFEFRAADSAASPYLQLAALVHAGAQGIQEELAAPKATEEDLSLLEPSALAARGYTRLPQTLEEALARFQSNTVVTDWFPAGFANLYVKHKQSEMAFLEGRDKAEICQAYAQVY